MAVVRHQQDLRRAVEVELAHRVHLQRPEARREPDVLLGREMLVAKYHHAVLEMGALDAREGGLVERPGKIEAGHLREKGLAEPANLECLAHGPRILA